MYQMAVDASQAVARRLGLPTWTGGSTGLMQAANYGALNEGRESIGVPMGGQELAGKEQTAWKAHTRTFPVTSYAVRIPLLMGDKNALIALPGTMGTLQEVAVTLAAMNDPGNSKAPLVFYCTEFYSGLFNLIQSLPLPQSVKSRVRMVNSPEELVRLVQDLR
jgi:predicted Rossmann-fold nucleotide-binding protein